MVQQTELPPRPAPPVPLVVRLSYRDMSLAWHVGGIQTLKAIKWATEGRNGQPSGGKFGANVIDERADFGGALGEISVSKAFNLWWTAPIDVAAGDVGDLVEVRAAFKRPRFGLKITHEDDDDLPFICVDLSSLPVVRLVGWDFAKECKREEWKMDPTGTGRPKAFFKPPHLLRDCAELKLGCHRVLAGEIESLLALALP